MNFWVFLSFQWRVPAFRMMAMALVLAVAAMCSVGVFSARIEAALMQDAQQLLGADRVLKFRQDPFQFAWWNLQQRTAHTEVRTTRTLVFPSMVSVGQANLLVSLKAADVLYPLRGQLRIVGRDGQPRTVNHGPSSGEVWVESGVLDALNLTLGQTLQVGLLPLVATHVVLAEPDRGGGFVQFAPRVLMHLTDISRTGLMGTGARATWRFYMSSDNPLALERYTQAIKAKAAQVGQRLEWETLESGRPEVFGALQRAKEFLLLAALVGSLLACVGMGLAAFLYASDQTRHVAILKSLGYSPKRLAYCLAFSLLSLGLMAGVCGVLLGVAGHSVLVWAVAGLLKFSLPWAGWEYLPLGLGVAVVLVFGFAAWPLWLALQQSVVAILRPVQSVLSWRTLWPILLSGFLAAFMVTAAVLRNPTMATVLLLGFVGVCAVFALVFWVVLRVLLLAVQGTLGQVGQRWSFVPMACRSMARRPWLLLAQGVALCLGLSALMVLTLVQGDLLTRWQSSIPSDAPNRFVFNIQPSQQNAVAHLLRENSPASVVLYPMVRGRLSHIQGQPVQPERYANPRSQRLLEREFNLSFTDVLPAFNNIRAGQWFGLSAGANLDTPEVSVEEGLAKQLGLGLGQTLRFDVAGQSVEAKITSLREVRWDSMQVNFYVIFPPKILQTYPQTWISAVYLPPERASDVSRALLKAFPNVTVLNTEALVEQLRSIVAQVGWAVQSVFLFTVLAGVLVVWVCGMVSAHVRQREVAIYRALGASRRHVVGAALIELGLVGGVAGGLAALCSSVMVLVLAQTVLQLNYEFSWSWLLGGSLLGMVLTVLVGIGMAVRVSLVPVAVTLRT